MKPFFLSIYYQVLIFTRVKIAVFFSFVFPVFIFIAFSFIWGYNNPDYSKFLLTGVIIMKVTSDALFSIGKVIVDYYQEGFVKFYKGLPSNIMQYIGALITSRILISLVTSLVLLSIGVIFFHVHFNEIELIYILLGITGAFVIFACLGLIIAILTADKGGDLSITNFIYFIMIFLSDLLYPLSDLNPSLGKAVAFLPINPVIALTRGNTASIIPVCIWSLILAGAFYISFRIKRIGR